MGEDEPIIPAGNRGDGLEELILRRRMRAFAKGSWLSFLPSAFSFFLLYVTFREEVPPDLMYGWLATGGSLIVLRMVRDRRRDIEGADLVGLRREWRLINLQLILGALVFGMMFPVLAWYGQGAKMGVLALVGATVFTSTLLMHRTAPVAARAHIFLIGASLILSVWLGASLRAWPSMVTIIVYALALLGAVRGQELSFLAAARNEVERREAEDTIRILLNDYQEQSSDWLWTTDAQGCLRDVSRRLAGALGLTAEEVEGRTLLSLILPGEGADRLGAALAGGTAFRDILVDLRIEGERRYWRLSARPQPDGGMRGVSRDVTRDRLTEERVAFMAHYDNLTGLANRYLFNERLNALLDDPGRADDAALFYLDLDDFKAVNDARGHLVGDRLLREVGMRLEQEVSGQDLVARLGGDEFAVLLETRAGAGLLIERAHRFLAVVREPYTIDEHVYRVSTSIGIARSSEGQCDAQELMRRADLALFAAKAKGRNTLALFEPALDRAARERRELEADLREAVARGELRLHYQPIIDLDSACITGYEALLRWYHPRRGLLAPGEFLHIVEETGLVVPIGEWVIRQALTETASWPGTTRISINLSPTQVRSPNLVAVVAQAFNATGYAPERVEFEITEHVLMTQGDAGYTTLLKLREMGASIALDDFGTGYSSLSYLRQFPFDRIKIDRHFVEDIEHSAENQAIVSSVTRLADALGMHTTAEGIERKAQLDMLRKLGCQEAQGFLICHPLPVGELPTGSAIDAGKPGYGAEVVDYRKAREAVLRRRGGSLG